MQLAEDEDYLQRADTFEASYNFRFQVRLADGFFNTVMHPTMIRESLVRNVCDHSQESESAHLLTYPRDIDGLVRKTDDRRKQARQRKADRKAAIENERVSEIRRLKNLKRAEMDQQVLELQRVSGHQDQRALSLLVDGDFDPAVYDAAMAATFDEGFYEVHAIGAAHKLRFYTFLTVFSKMSCMLMIQMLCTRRKMQSKILCRAGWMSMILVLRILSGTLRENP